MNDFLVNRWARTRDGVNAFDGMSADAIRNLPLSEFGRRAGMATPAVATPPATPPATAATGATGQTEEQPAGKTIAEMTNAEYAAFRAANGIGQSRKEGVGLFNQPGSQTWAEAAQSQPKRSGWQGSNVEESPRIPRPNLVGVDRPNLDTRSVGERFGTASNAYRYEG